ncbi:MAG: lipopolysaccharide biosynthesis protein, partial [Polyangiaceae bacterium]
VRTGVALAACVAFGLVAPRVGRLMTPVLALAAGAAYVALLVVLRELGPRDLAMVRALYSKKGT